MIDEIESLCSNLAYFWDPALTQNVGSTFALEITNHKKNEEVELPQTWGSTSVQPKVGRTVFWSVRSLTFQIIQWLSASGPSRA